MQHLEKQQQRIAKLVFALPAPHKVPLWMLRASYQGLDSCCGLAKIQMQQVQNVVIPGPETGHHIKLRIYQPTVQTLGTLVYFHGGGCVIGNLDSHDAFCRLLAHHGQHHVVSVDYRRAPQAKYPSAILDAIHSWNEIIQRGDQWGLNMHQVGVGGDSAGAYLSALIGLESEHKSLGVSAHQQPDYQLLLYPMLDQRFDYESNQIFNRDLLLTQDLVALFRQLYLSSPAQATEPLASPVLSQHLAQSPKTCLITVEFDPLRDSGLAYARALQAEGVEIQHLHFEHCLHGFISVGRFSPEARLKSEQVCQQLKVLAGG